MFAAAVDWVGETTFAWSRRGTSRLWPEKLAVARTVAADKRVGCGDCILSMAVFVRACGLRWGDVAELVRGARLASSPWLQLRLGGEF